jgi:DNA-binding beta-propeller fold protein YncE
VLDPGSGTVSTIDVKTRTKNPTDIAVGSIPTGFKVSPDGNTLFAVSGYSGTVSPVTSSLTTFFDAYPMAGVPTRRLNGARPWSAVRLPADLRPASASRTRAQNVGR